MIDWNLFKRAAGIYKKEPELESTQGIGSDKPPKPITGGFGDAYSANKAIPKPPFEVKTPKNETPYGRPFGVVPPVQKAAPDAEKTYGNEDQPAITGAMGSASGVGNAIQEMDKEKPKVKMPETMASSSEETGGPSLLRQYGLPLGILGAGALSGYGLYNMFKKKKKRRYEEDDE